MGPGRNDLEIMFAPSVQAPVEPEMHVSFRDGAVNIPLRKPPFRVLAIDSDGREMPVAGPAVRSNAPGRYSVSAFRIPGGEFMRPFLRIPVSEPGLYLLEGFELSPFERVPSRIVRVEIGAVTEVVYELERAD